MTPQVQQALLVVIYWLDAEMEKSPTRKMADATNFLQDLYDNTVIKERIKHEIEGMDS